MAENEAIDVTKFVALAGLNLAAVLSETEATVYLALAEQVSNKREVMYVRKVAKEQMDEMARYILRRLVRQLAVARLQEGDEDGEASGDS